MPYVNQELRDVVDKIIDEYILKIETYIAPQREQGEKLAKLLTYTFFKIVVKIYAHQRVRWYHRMDVEKICKSVWGEFKRRFLDSYEDEAMKRHGDVK